MPTSSWAAESWLARAMMAVVAVDCTGMLPNGRLRVPLGTGRTPLSGTDVIVDGDGVGAAKAEVAVVVMMVAVSRADKRVAPAPRRVMVCAPPVPEGCSPFMFLAHADNKVD